MKSLSLRFALAHTPGYGSIGDQTPRHFDFTIHDLPFACIPRAGDRFAMCGSVFTVSHTFHFLGSTEGEPAMLTVLDELQCRDQLSFYTLLDQFKAEYQLSDVIASQDEPDFYYVVWRAVGKILAETSHQLPRDQITVKLFAEVSRAVILTANGLTSEDDLPADTIVMDIHLAISKLIDDVFNPLEILDGLGLNTIAKRQLDLTLAARLALKLLEKYRSIPPERLRSIYAAADRQAAHDNDSGGF